MSDLIGKAALITGGTSGIGLATAERLADRGADLLVAARTPKPEFEALVARASGKAEFVVADLSDPDASAMLGKEAQRLFERLDFVVHSAGGNVPGKIEDLTAEAWMHAFDVHVHSTFHLFRACLPLLRAKGGSVMLLSSVAGLRGCPNSVAYQTVKGALPQMARALARDHAAEDVRVNCVAPGVIRTPFHAAMPEDVRLNNIENRIPLKREGTPDDVASLIVEMLTNRFITGECFAVDGGMTMRIA
ncbi:SDR family oxidoreductase [Boseongicola sp. H5]|uniref:SDR family NAD(P)-dependent oxidoreductase n=1 Tax=Boseongicola sp. H5 TaxID=2763261 RepID=UPI001D0B4013|nr:SDR family oxidoreductase [Boseongicola sp. H5]